MPPAGEGCCPAGSTIEHTVDTGSSSCAGQSPPSQPSMKQTGDSEDKGGPTAERTSSIEAAGGDPEEDSPFAELFSGSESSGEEDETER